MNRLVIIAIASAVINVSVSMCASATDFKSNFNIPPMPLAEALNHLAKKSERALLFPYQDVCSLRTEGVTGEYTFEDALDEVLIDTGLQAHETDDGITTLIVVIQNNNSEQEKSMNKKSIKRCLMTGASAALIASTVPITATAQTQEAVDEITRDVIEEIVISSSRIRSNGYQEPTPTTTVNASQINDIPQPSIAEVLNQMPSMGATTTPRTGGNQVGGGLQGTSSLNLRGLRRARTLVLLDRHRVVSADVTGTVDINLLPTNLLKRVDIVTGGASAAWGSDAVAGVVNIILDKEYEGFKVDIQGGTSGESDGDERKVSLGGGIAFDDGRGHIIGSATFATIDSIDQINSRSWYNSTKLFDNPDYVAGNGQPQRIPTANVGSTTYHLGGIIGGRGSLAGTTFGPGGTIGQLTYDRQDGTTRSNIIGGDAATNDFDAYSQLSNEVDRKNIYLRANYDVTDKINVYGELAYGYTEAESLSVPYQAGGRGGALTIQSDNAFIPDALDLGGASSFSLARYNLDVGRTNPHNERELQRYVVGATFDLDDSWQVEAYYQHGVSDIVNEVRNDPIVATFVNAVDSVYANGVDGEIVCRSTLTNPNDGCVPLNVFGYGSPSAAAIDHVTGVAKQNIKITQDVIAATVTGDVMELPAGNLAVAFGAEYREEDHKADADALSLTNSFYVGNYKPSSGGYNVKEVFAEVSAPVFQDSAFGEALNLSAAVRFTDYSTSGSVVTWKTGLTYDIAGGVRFRATKSRDIRAPNLAEYYLGGAVRTQTVDNPWNGNVEDTIFQTTIGNPEVLPEEADTTTFGFVYQPEYIKGLSVSIDYYDIAIDDAIDVLSNEQLVEYCFDDGVYCNFVHTATPGDYTVLTGLDIAPINFASENISGVDFEASYRMDIGAGTLSLDTRWGYVKEHTRDNGVTVDNILNEFAARNSGMLRLKGFSSLGYSQDDLRLSLRARYIGEGVTDHNVTPDQADNTVDAITYFDLSAAKTVTVGGNDYQLYASVDNLFDKEPPLALPLSGRGIGVQSGSHDLVGRYFRTGVRVNF